MASIKIEVQQFTRLLFLFALVSSCNQTSQAELIIRDQLNYKEAHLDSLIKYTELKEENQNAINAIDSIKNILLKESKSLLSNQKAEFYLIVDKSTSSLLSQSFSKTDLANSELARIKYNYSGTELNTGWINTLFENQTTGIALIRLTELQIDITSQEIIEEDSTIRVNHLISKEKQELKTHN